jgi:hypothetical protein
VSSSTSGSPCSASAGPRRRGPADESALTGLRGLPRPRQQGVLSVARCDLRAVAEREPALRDAALHFLRLLGADPGQPGAAERA